MHISAVALGFVWDSHPSYVYVMISIHIVERVINFNLENKTNLIYIHTWSPALDRLYEIFSDLGHNACQVCDASYTSFLAFG